MRATRREFLGSAAAAAWAAERKVSIVVLPEAAPVRWAAGALRAALEARGVRADVLSGPGEAGPGRVVIGQSSSSMPAESFALAPGRVTGADARGAVYGTLELADRVRYGGDPAAALWKTPASREQPANQVRSVTRLFVSDVEDKGWFYDQNFWSDYLTMLVSQRFNRFSLALGLGYDLPHHVLDAYFIFAYPFLMKVPGYDVTVRGLAPEERERNMAMLQWIARATVARGLEFQLGLWSHTYRWIDSPQANYVIDGLTPATHGPYCRAAVRTLLERCPEIGGITFRAHSESGIPDGSYGFWQQVWAGVGECGRRVEIDLHSKGIDFRQVRMALDTKQPVRISCKLTAEHQGLPAHQSAIRELERTRPSSTPQDRSFTRYGYADYLAEDREWGVYYRVWPGKDKVLLWSDPAMAAGYGRSAGFCGSQGLELCEPLTFKGRQGSGSTPDRRIYSDASLRPAGGDWRKYLYTYRLWGRYLYDPEAKPESYRRYLRSEFSAAATAVETSLAYSSRITPLITSAHLPSGAGMSYWVEMYTNMPIADAKLPHPYGDTPSPRVFGRVSPLDPGLFSSVHDFVAGPPDGRYSPADVARWLEEFAARSEEAWRKAPKSNDAAFRRVDIDIAVYNGLGRFFANKLRAAVAYERGNVAEALHHYRAARDAWVWIVERTRRAYVSDLTFGITPHMRGNWADRLPAIERDIAYMETQVKDAGTARALTPRPPAPAARHTAPARFSRGQPLELTLASPAHAVELHYRHVNQAEEYQVVKMTGGRGAWRAEVPAGYTDSRFPLLYHFVLRDAGENAWRYPGLAPDLSNQPYFVVRSVA